MSTDGEETNGLDHLPPDPLLKPGAFIDPTTNGYPQDPPGFAEPIRSASPSTPIHNPEYSDEANLEPEAFPSAEPASKHNKAGGPEPPGESTASETFDWLPPGWRVEYRVRASGASAGSRDKYYVDPVSNRRFRSRKEVQHYLEHGRVKKRSASSDGDSPVTTASGQKQKRRKIISKPAVSADNFKFDDVPEKVKWELTDVYAASWRPLIRGVEEVPDAARQEWAAAFTHVSMQSGATPTD